MTVVKKKERERERNTLKVLEEEEEGRGALTATKRWGQKNDYVGDGEEGGHFVEVNLVLSVGILRQKAWVEGGSAGSGVQQVPEVEVVVVVPWRTTRKKGPREK